MATKVHHMEALKGIDGLQALMTILTNPAKYDSVFKELKNIHDETKVLVEAVGPAREIPKLLNAAKTELANSKRSSEEAFLKIREANKAALDKIKAEEHAAKERIAQAEAQLNGRAHQLAADRADLMRKLRDFDADRKAMDERLEKLSIEEHAAAALKEKYEEKLRRFKEVTND